MKRLILAYPRQLHPHFGPWRILNLRHIQLLLAFVLEGCALTLVQIRMRKTRVLFVLQIDEFPQVVSESIVMVVVDEVFLVEVWSISQGVLLQVAYDATRPFLLMRWRSREFRFAVFRRLDEKLFFKGSLYFFRGNDDLLGLDCVVLVLWFLLVRFGRISQKRSIEVSLALDSRNSMLMKRLRFWVYLYHS